MLLEKVLSNCFNIDYQLLELMMKMNGKQLPLRNDDERREMTMKTKITLLHLQRGPSPRMVLQKL